MFQDAYRKQSYALAQEYAQLMQHNLEDLLQRYALNPGDTVVTANGPLTLVDTIKTGEAILTDDGGPAIRNEWHEGPSSGDVYYEVYTYGGRTAHGFVDVVTRKLTQVG